MIPYEIILGSASPRRRELLLKVIPRYMVITTEGELAIDSSVEPSRFAAENAAHKAECILNENHFSSPSLILTFDTVVAFENTTYGKPENDAHAKEMLLNLSGKVHQVYTGYCIRSTDGEINKSSFTTTDVEFLPLSEDEIKSYLDTKEHTDKAGAYGIQGAACVFVKGIQGCYFNVVGLPVSSLYSELVELFGEEYLKERVV
jgi:septum formation protein